MTISDGFKTLLARIAPLQSEIDAAERHIATIRTRLAEAYTLKGFVRAGSYSRDTFIRGSSDVDLFAVITSAPPAVRNASLKAPPPPIGRCSRTCTPGSARRTLAAIRSNAALIPRKVAARSSTGR